MKSRQEGSMAAVVAVTVTAIGLTAMTVQNYRQTAKNTVTVAGIRRSYEAKHDAAINAASRFKSLLSPALSGGRYIPGILATNYFDDKWTLKRNPSSPIDATLSGNNGVTIQLASNSETEFAAAMKVLKNDESFKNAAGTKSAFNVNLVNVNRDDPDHMDLVTSVDVRVDTKEDNGKTLSSSFRVPIKQPEGRNPTLKYRLKNTGNYQPVTGDLDVAPGTYQFQAYGSGIIYYANLSDNNVPVKMGWNPNGSPAHGAVTWDAEDQPIGAPIEVNISDLKVDHDVDLDRSSCTETKDVESAGLPASHVVKMEMIGVDGKPIPGGNNGREFTIRISQASIASQMTPHDLTGKDYETMCADQCPYYGPAVDPDVTPDLMPLHDHFGNQTRHWDNNSNATAGDMSSAFTYMNAQEYGLKTVKLCLNVDKPGLDLQNTDYFHWADLVVYSPGSCHRKFLLQRENCGCVAEDTQITMGDGKTQKRIDEIGPTDTVWNPVLKKAMAIHHLSRGPEKVPLLTIKAGGDVLNATGNHPFPTHTGMRTAFQLEVGEEIQLASGQWVKVESVAVKTHEKGHAPIVWNIEIDAPQDNWDAHHYVANGIDTGDLFIQRTLENGKLSAKN